MILSGTQHGVGGPFGFVHDRVWFVENNIFATKMGKMGQPLSLVINFLWTWSLMKCYIICCILPQMPH